MKEAKILRHISWGALISLFIMMYLVEIYDVQPSENFGKDDIFVFLYGTALAFVALAITCTARIQDLKKARESEHLTIGGYIPSVELNEVIREYFYRRGGSSNWDTDYVNKWKNAKKLLGLVEQHRFYKNIANQEITCRVLYNGTWYEGVSASKEMALCIAFLGSCGYDVNRTIEI